MNLKPALKITFVEVKMNTKNNNGFTLIEILLVLVIISMIIVMGIGYMQQKAQSLRIDKTSLQMQQILNAGMAYYVSHGKWPADLKTLQDERFLPDELNSPFGNEYKVTEDMNTTPKNPNQLYVYTQLPAGMTGLNAVSQIIAGKLPLGYSAQQPGSPPPQAKLCSDAAPCEYVVGSVNIPGQNLNNATAVNFASLYQHGACVPVPECPVDAGGTTMTPQIFAVPASVSGANDAKNPSNVYPISSFTAYATASSKTPDPCEQGGLSTCPDPQHPGKNEKYWRVCLKIVTERGEIKLDQTDWGSKAGTILAITRCAITDEPSGTKFRIFP